MPTSRRRFLKDSLYTTAAIGVSSALSHDLLAETTRVPASDKINVALIGCKNMGFGILQLHLKQPSVECIALCDVDKNVLESRAAEVEKLKGRRPLLYGDYRKLLENKDIDAVIVGTPDHWHCLIMVAACAAGKDVYVEKPMANSIEECNIMVKAAKRYNRIVQVGQQQRSGKSWQDAIEAVWTGKIGKIRKIKVWANFAYGKGRKWVPDEPVPAGVDFDMWLGPAPQRTFNPARFHGSWRMFWDYGGGLMTDWGVHLIDMALWAMKVNAPPKSVISVGGIFASGKNAIETADTQTTIFEFDNWTLTWDHNGGIQTGPYGRIYGLEFIGENGTIVADRDNWENYPEWDEDAKAFKMEKLLKVTSEGKDHEYHVKNFLACLKTREKPACDVETGRLAALYCHLGNISYRSGKRLVLDPAGKSFLNEPEVNRYLVPTYRAPWQLPGI